MADATERRRAPRVQFQGNAEVFIGNDQYQCGIFDISKKGALVAPRVDTPPGTFIRLNIILPELDGTIDVDAVVVRETDADGAYATGVEFVSMSDRASALLDIFVKYTLHQNGKDPQSGRRVAEETGPTKPPPPDPRQVPQVRKKGLVESVKRTLFGRPPQDSAARLRSGSSSEQNIHGSGSRKPVATSPQASEREPPQDELERELEDDASVDRLLGRMDLRDLYRKAVTDLGPKKKK